MALARVPPAILMRVGNPDDPRAQRTRTLLIAELETQLRAETSPPTVTSIVLGARVSRSAFYAHFASIEELGAAAIRRALDDLGPTRARSAGSAGGDATQLTYGDFFQHIAEHRHLYTGLVTGHQGPARTELYRALVEQIHQAIEDTPGRPEEIASHRVATFIAGGLLAALSDWLQTRDGSPQDLADAVIALMPTWFAGDQTTAPTLKVSE